MGSQKKKRLSFLLGLPVVLQTAALFILHPLGHPAGGQTRQTTEFHHMIADLLKAPAQHLLLPTLVLVRKSDSQIDHANAAMFLVEPENQSSQCLTEGIGEASRQPAHQSEKQSNQQINDRIQEPFHRILLVRHSGRGNQVPVKSLDPQKEEIR